MSPVLIFLGLLFLIIGVVYRFITVPKLRREIERRTGEAMGIITRTKVVRNRHRARTYYYDFSYTVDGQDYELKRVRSPLSCDEGEEYELSVNPDEPSDAHVNKLHTDPETGKKVSYFFLISGAICFIIGVIILLAK